MLLQAMAVRHCRYAARPERDDLGCRRLRRTGNKIAGGGEGVLESDAWRPLPVVARGDNVVEPLGRACEPCFDGLGVAFAQPAFGISGNQ